MSEKVFYKEIVLNGDESNLLRHLLVKRLRIFIAACIGMVFCWLQAAYSNTRNWYLLHFVIGTGAIDDKWMEKIDNYFWASVILLIVLIGYFIHVLFRKIVPLHKDIRQLKGVCIPMQIKRKSMPYDGRHFFFFDDLKIPHKEVDYDVYYQYSVGDMFVIVLAKYSRTLIDEYMNIPLF